MNRRTRWFGYLLVLVAPSLSAQEVKSGKALYEESCLVCHGEEGEGAMPGVSALSGKDGALVQPESDLLKSIRDGVQREGAVIAMPPLGGNPNLTEQDVRNIINYMRKSF